MLKILFSPSEAKNSGGNLPPYSSDSLLFSSLSQKREDVIELYMQAVSMGEKAELSKLFGLQNEQDFFDFLSPIRTMPTMQAIKRYCGVAYEYLDFDSLDAVAKHYTLTNVIIFSNLFGPVLASDSIPNYKLKQGETFGNFKLEEHFKKHFSAALDEYLTSDEILDLRAGYYEKFYKPSKEYVSVKFLKNGKVVSHYAKAYRGKLLREIAKRNITSTKELTQQIFDDMELSDIVQINKKIEMVFDITKEPNKGSSN